MTICLMVLFTSCTEESYSKVQITVSKNNSGQANEVVYLYDATTYDTFGAKKMLAGQKSATNNQGIATFIIDVRQYDLSAKQQTFYFVTFDGETEKGKIALTVFSGQDTSGKIIH